MREGSTSIRLLMICMLFSACSDKYQSLFDAAPVPQLRFDRDTVVLREKDYLHISAGLNPYLKLFAVPSPPQMHILFNDSSQKMRFIYRGVKLEDGMPVIVAGDSTILFCACDTAGLYAVDFYLTDQLGKSDSRQLVIQCVANERPKASLAVSLIDSSISSNWQYRLDGSGAFKRFGLITSYQFTIEGLLLFSVPPFIDYTFHTRGEHSVSLFVTDDLGVHSDTVTQKIIIK